MTVEEFYKLLLGATVRNIIWADGKEPKISQILPYHLLVNIKAIILQSGQIIEFGQPYDPNEIAKLMQWDVKND